MARDVSSIRPEEEEEVDEEEDDDEEEEDDDEEEEEEMVLDEFGRIPGGILPDNPCYPDLDYSFRSFASFVDASDKVLPPYPSVCQSSRPPSLAPTLCAQLEL